MEIFLKWNTFIFLVKKIEFVVLFLNFIMENEDILLNQKQLFLEIKEKEDDYASGRLDLKPCLIETDKLYHKQVANHDVDIKHVNPDVALIGLQANLLQKCASKKKISDVAFEPKEFSLSSRKYFTSSILLDNNEIPADFWQKIGDDSQSVINSVPIFDFINNTFIAKPIELSKRKFREPGKDKDKAGDIATPKQLQTNQLSNQDIMMQEHERVYSIFLNCYNKQKKPICFYEFVIDPLSFTRTIENIFIISLLVKDNHIQIFADSQGLPFMKTVPDNRKKNHSLPVNQSIISLTFEDWQEIIRKFNIVEAKIYPSKSQSST